MAMPGTEDRNGTPEKDQEIVWIFGMLAEEYTVRVVWTVCMLLAGGICYAVLRNGVTETSAFIAGMILFFGCLVAWSIAPGPELVLEARLRVEESTRRGSGRVVAFKRRGGGDSTTGVRLTVLLDVAGAQHPVQVKATVEDALLANFGTGKTVHLLYDPNDLTRVAIDRQASPTFVS